VQVVVLPLEGDELLSPLRNVYSGKRCKWLLTLWHTKLGTLCRMTCSAAKMPHVCFKFHLLHHPLILPNATKRAPSDERERQRSYQDLPGESCDYCLAGVPNLLIFLILVACFLPSRRSSLCIWWSVYLQVDIGR
jgi:hypothetical protein